MQLSMLFILFIIYSVIGWISEVIYCSVIQRKLVNRGFLHGPLCPIYGIGGLLVIYLLEPFSGNLFYLLSMAVIVTSVLEYVSSWALESIFATKWWDYSDMRFNIHGRVCLLNSLIFGVMGAVGVRVLHPFTIGLVSRIPSESLEIISVVLAVILLFDLALTLRALFDFEAKLAELTEFMGDVKASIDVREWFNELDLAGSLERLREKAVHENSELNRKLILSLERLTAMPREMVRLLSAFPAMKSLRHGIQLDLFRNLHIRRAAALNHVFRSSKEVNVASIRFSSASASSSASTASSGTVRQAASFAGESLDPVRPLSTRAYEYFWVFIIASYIGVILESLWCVATTGHFESRSGLVYGMLNPIYGGGAVLMSIVFSKYDKRHDLVVFLGSMVIGGGLEYCCSLVQELAFNSVSWEYSQTQLNLHGRTNLMFSLIWGVLGLVWVRYIFPMLLRLIRRIPKKFGRICASIFFVALLANILVSASAVHRWAGRDGGISPDNVVDRFLDEHYPDDFMKNVYPNLKFL